MALGRGSIGFDWAVTRAILNGSADLAARHAPRITRQTMVIGACTVELYLAGNGSLKGKRGILKPLLNRLRREFNLAAAEVGCNDMLQTAEVGLATVGNDPGHAHAVLEKAVRWIESHYPDVQVVDWQIEIL